MLGLNSNNGEFKQLFKQTTDVLKFTVNGRGYSVRNPGLEVMLVQWLRRNGLTGTKFSCGQGGCGACTVILVSQTMGSQPIYHPINACLRPLAAMHGLELLTVEALGSSTEGKMDDVQKAIAEYNGTQCGYCTPGFVCAMKAYLQNTESNPNSRTLPDIEDIFDGHLCRCTGYRPILCGMKTFAVCKNEKERKNTPQLAVKDRYYSTGDIQHDNVTVIQTIGVEETDSGMPEVPSTKLPPTPEEPVLCVFECDDHKDRAVWMKIQTKAQLHVAMNHYSSQKRKIRFIVGNTAYGIQIFQEKIKEQTIRLHIGDIPDFLSLKKLGDGSTLVGAAVRIQSLYDYCVEESSGSPLMLVMRQHLKRLATTEIRHAGSVGGNIYLAKAWGFPSDLVCILMTLDASIAVLYAGKNSPERYIRMADFMSSVTCTLDGGCIIHSIKIPPIAPGKNVFTRTYKVSARPQNSHPLVNGGFAVEVDKGRFKNVRIVFGNIKEKTCRMPKTEQYLTEHCNPEELSTQVLSILSCLYTELKESITVSHGFENVSSEMVENDKHYRSTTARNLLLKFLINLADVFELSGWNDVEKIKSCASSLITERMDSTSSGSQDFCVYSNEHPISEPIVKQSAFLQACGEARYTQDLAMSSHDLLHGVYVFNTKYAHAKFHPISLPQKFHKKFPNVVKVFTAEDVVKKVQSTSKSPSKQSLPEKKKDGRNNVLGPGYPGLPEATMFAKGEVIYNGQPMGMVVAENEEIAREAAKWIQENAIEWKRDLREDVDDNPVLDLKVAIEKKRCFPDSTTNKKYPERLLKVSTVSSLDKIDWDQVQKDHPDCRIVEGEQLVGSQYHFYMENQTAVAYFQEGKIKLVASTQSPSTIQKKVAQVCSLPMNHVTVEVPRLGGGYGGKELQSQFVAVAASFCAQSLKKPVSVSLSRTEDMEMIGKGHEVLGKYKIAASEKTRKIHALQLEFLADGGCTYDASFAVMDLMLLSADNAYFIPEFLCTGQVFHTFKATSTAIRSFGVIQALITVEAAIEAVSEKIGKLPEDVRKANFYETVHHSADEQDNVRIAEGRIADNETTELGSNQEGRSEAFQSDQTDGIISRQDSGFREGEPPSKKRVERQHSEEPHNKDPQMTPFGQPLRYCNLQGVWDHVVRESEYERRRELVVQFNKSNKLKKRGIKLIPVKYGISFGKKAKNQACATVQVHSTDSTVLINIGGVEMGQGLKTKMKQIAVYALDIPFDKIEIGTTSTEKIPNATSTGASTGSDLNGGAVKNACKDLRGNLETLLNELVRNDRGSTYSGRKKDLLDLWKLDTKKSWKDYWPEVVSIAYEERVNLVGRGFYRSPDIDQLSNEKPKGRPFYYFNYAAAVSEVEIDVLTGETTILRSDIVYDAGHSLNPAIDVGQIEGGFMMGVGNVLTEKLIYDKDGRLLTNGTWEYKPPDTRTIPKDFRVTLYPGGKKRPKDRIDHTQDEIMKIDPHGIQSSKTTGEPPLVLANTVFFAVRDAVREARKEMGLSCEFQFNSPATVVDVQLACGFDPKCINFSDFQQD